MEKVSVYCINTEKDLVAEVLERSDKRLRVVFVDTTLTLTLSRKDTRGPYIGTSAGLEFETFGTEED